MRRINRISQSAAESQAFTLMPLLAFALLFALASCGDDDSETASEKDNFYSEQAKQRAAPRAEKDAMGAPKDVPTARAVSYSTIDSKSEGAGSRKVYQIWIAAPDAQGEDALAQTALKAASDLAKRRKAARIESYVIPTEERAFVGSKFTRATATVEKNRWRARVAGQNLSEDDLIFLEIYVKNLPDYRDEGGRIRRRELYTYIARIMGVGADEVARSVRRARRALSGKETYRP